MLFVTNCLDGFSFSFLSLKRDNVNFPLKWVISSREGWTPARPGFMKWYITIILSSCSNSNLFSQFCDEVVCNIWSLKSVSHVLRNNQKKNSIYCFGGFGGAGWCSSSCFIRTGQHFFVKEKHWQLLMVDKMFLFQSWQEYSEFLWKHFHCGPVTPP